MQSATRQVHNISMPARIMYAQPIEFHVGGYLELIRTESCDSITPWVISIAGNRVSCGQSSNFELLKLAHDNLYAAIDYNHVSMLNRHIIFFSSNTVTYITAVSVNYTA